MSKLSLLFLLNACILLAACGAQTNPAAGPDADAVATIVAATLSAEPPPSHTPNPSPEPADEDTGLLPQSLYFLSNASGARQVWRLERDGVTLTQITSEASDVEGFHVSPADGQLAYISNNQLWLADSGGGNRQMLIDGSGADPEANDYYYVERVSAPRFSPDGRWLAYAHDGLRLVDLGTGTQQHILSNLIDDSDEDFIRPEELYFPEAWSPDGMRLLVAIGYLEGGTLAVYDFDNADLIHFQASHILCCQSTWTQDSAAVLVASPYLGLVAPGLWRYDAASGAESVLVQGSQEDGTFHYLGWPATLADGQLVYLYSSSAGIPEGEVSLFMMRSEADGQSGREQLRQESFNVREALWAPDGSLALVVENPPVPTGGVNGGALLLVAADGSPTQVLANEASGLQWGP